VRGVEVVGFLVAGGFSGAGEGGVRWCSWLICLLACLRVCSVCSAVCPLRTRSLAHPLSLLASSILGVGSRSSRR